MSDVPIVSRETFSFTDDELQLIVRGLKDAFMMDLVGFCLPKDRIRPLAELHNKLCGYVGAKPIKESFYIKN